jgi:hypothetical protein
VERWGPFGVTRDWDGGRFHGEGRFFPVNAGSWNFWLDTSERGQELRFHGTEIPSRLGRLTLDLGDFTVVDPRRDPLHTEFQEAVWLRGGGAALTRGAVTYGVHGGMLTQHASAFGWGRDPLFAGAFGLSAGGEWHQHSIWRVNWDRQESTPLLGSGLQVAKLFVGRQPPEGWSWLGQARLSRLDDRGAFGESVIGGGGYTLSRFALFGHARWISPEFQELGLNPDPHADEWGGRLELSFRPRRLVLLGTSWDWARDIRPRPGRASGEERLTSRFFVSTPVAGPLTFNGTVGYRNRTTADPESLLVDQGAMSWSGGFGWSGKRGSAEIDFTRSLMRDPTSTTGDWHEDRVEAHGQVRVTGELHADLRGWTADRRFLNGTWASYERRGEVRMNWEPRPRARGWLGVARDRQDASDQAYARDEWEIGAGWGQGLPWGLTLDVESLFYVPVGPIQADRTRINLRVARQFSFGGARPGGQGPLSEFGIVRGAVFVDGNANGRRDPGEEGIPGQVIRLGSGAETVTDADGGYEFDRAATVLESVTLEDARLPTRYLTPDATRATVRLRPAESATVDYPVQLAASLAGRVMLDYGDHAEGAPDVLLRVQGTHHDVFTDPEGRFYIPGLEPGPVTLEVVAWSLPADADHSAPLTRNAVLRGGEGTYVGILAFPVKKPEVLQFYRSGQPH